MKTKYLIYVLSLMILFIFTNFHSVVSNMSSPNPPIPPNGASKYKEFVERVLSLTGTTSIEFSMVEDYQIANCLTTCSNNEVILKYNPVFLEDVEKGFGFSESKIIDWVKQGVLAHESGHIALDHCSKYRSGSKQAEIEADIFMGAVLHLLGATLSQAQSCLYLPDVSIEGNYTYPSRKERLENAKAGWQSIQKHDDIGEKELELARRLYIAGSRSNYKKAFPLFYKNRNKEFFTDTDMYMLGFMYLKGKGTHKSFDNSLKWLGKSYDLGNQKAYHLYRLLYY